MKGDVAIVGGGPAGYTAGLYAARAGLRTLLISETHPGGLLMTTTGVENFPGFAHVQGPDLMHAMMQQCANVGVNLVTDRITGLGHDEEGFILQGQDTSYLSRTVIAATGAQPRWLGVPGETTFRGYGVSSCATCDGFFFKGKNVAVVGGGNTAAEEAIFLAGLCRHVTLIHRRDTLRADHVMQTRLRALPQVTFLWNTVVEEIVGRTEPHKAVTHLHVKDAVTGDRNKIDVEGIFMAIGHTPCTGWLNGIWPTDASGYLVPQPTGPLHGPIKGLFAAGDIIDQDYRQAITAAGQGCMAALEAQRFLGCA